MPQNDQIWPKIGIFGQFGPGHAGFFGALWWVSWWLWRAGCISQDTYLLYLLFFRQFPILLKISISHLYICIFVNGHAQSQWGIFSQIFCCNFLNLILRGHLKCYHVTNNFFSDDHIEIAYHWSRRLI